MEIVVTNIGNETSEIYCDDEALNVQMSDKYTISFNIVVDDSVIDSVIRIQHKGDLSFAKARDLIKDKLGVTSNER